jgi:hypothetical protein
MYNSGERGRLLLIRIALVVVGSFALGAAVGAAVMAREPWSAKDAAKSNTITGSMTLKERVDTVSVVGYNPKTGDPCHAQASSGYDDIRAGAQVLVRDSADKTIATGALAEGTTIAIPGNERGIAFTTEYCCSRSRLPAFLTLTSTR